MRHSFCSAAPPPRASKASRRQASPLAAASHNASASAAEVRADVRASAAAASSMLREVLLAMDAVYYLERLVEIAEQSYEVVRRRTILDRSEAAAIKRRVRAKLRVAAMMKKMSLPEASAAPAVVTPSTPTAAPSAAKGVFARAVAVDEQSD